MAHYIDNKKLYESICSYVHAYRKAVAEDKPLPKVPEYCGQAMMDIADGLGSRPNFSGYSYLEEMKADGIMDCIKYLHNYNIDKYPKPFSYINRIIWQAFVRRIEKEKKQQITKYKIMYRDIDLVLPPEIEKDIRSKIEQYEDKRKKD